MAQTVNGKLPPTISPPPLPTNGPKSLQLLTRLNLTLADPAQNQRLATLSQAYDIVALRPTNEKLLLNACTNLECDVISLDLSVRLPYHFKFKMLSAAIARGIRIEICYGPGVTGSGLDARRNLIGNATSLIRATRGRGIIVSSEARRALSLRAPWDVINLACVWGLSQERGKEAICEEARKVTALARLKRTSWRGIVDIVHGGEKLNPAESPQKSNVTSKKQTQKPKEATQEESGTDKLKRKASISSEPVAEDLDKPLSKKEIKRRAKKAKFDAKGGNAT